jgi:hypothetical protein
MPTAGQSPNAAACRSACAVAAPLAGVAAAFAAGSAAAAAAGGPLTAALKQDGAPPTAVAEAVAGAAGLSLPLGVMPEAGMLLAHLHAAAAAAAGPTAADVAVAVAGPVAAAVQALARLQH